ncbi:sushi domain-containing protein 4-like [Mustela erminea]|uniref:sushi domain-containing protein 4-like n=1 Tax=Mustela erminea TaxID=36723 RepID=UPI0013866AAF|nr:sushi domain-containing protein 4-like [Mustela erminea]
MCSDAGFDDLPVCADPGVPENGFRTPGGGLFLERSVTQFHCQDGFTLQGPTKRLCVRHLNGTLGWIPSDKPFCAQEDCRIPQIDDAEIHNRTYRHGDKLIVTCHEGFKIRYPDLYNMVSLCRDDGTWDNLPLCQGCLRPLASSNGYANISELQTSFPVGTVISYHCFPGYKLEGAEHLECLHSLIWSTSPPRCLALEVCPLPPTVTHGDFVCHPRPCERYSHGTVVEFSCDAGYSLTSDYKYITCQYGQWFPSYQVYCIQSEQTWPSAHETLLTTWKIVAFTATSVLLVLLLVILARMFQTKFKAHFPTRRAVRQEASTPAPPRQQGRHHSCLPASFLGEDVAGRASNECVAIRRRMAVPWPPSLTPAASSHLPPTESRASWGSCALAGLPSGNSHFQKTCVFAHGTLSPPELCVPPIKGGAGSGEGVSDESPPSLASRGVRDSHSCSSSPRGASGHPFHKGSVK